MSDASMKGMNPGELEACAESLDSLAAQMMAAGIALTFRLSQLQWQGSDALKAREYWSAQIKTQVEEIAADLHSCARTARENASEQRRVSRT